MCARLILSDAEGNGRFARDADVLDLTMRFNIARRSVNIREHTYSAEIDGVDLLRHLCSSRPKHRKRTHDWFLVERLIRDFIMTRGSQSSNETIMKHCEDEYDKYRTNGPLTRSFYAELVRRLREEYEISA
jgi:hypothetical protein